MVHERCCFWQNIGSEETCERHSEICPTYPARLTKFSMTSLRHRKGSPQGVQKRQSPVLVALGRVFEKEMRMLTTFISLLGSLAQANLVWNGDIVVVMSGGGVDWPWICILAVIVCVAWVITSRKR